MADISHVKLPNGQTYDLKDALLRNHLGDFEESSDCFPYTLRPTCDGKMDIGDRAYLDKIVGGTVAWNQLLSESNLYPYSTTIKTITPQKVVLTPNGRFSTTLHYGASITSGDLEAIPLNHVLFVCVDCASTKADKFRIRIGNSMFWSASVSANTTVRINAIAPFASATLTVYAYDDTLYSTADEITFQNWNIFDLTQMFGFTIADYIYSLEQSTPGAGVAWFRKLFPEDYYPYNSGELLSVEGLQSHDTTGLNQWDEEWEVGSISWAGNNSPSSTTIRSKNYIKCLPGVRYYGKTAAVNGNIQLFYYDADKTFISYEQSSVANRAFTTPANAHYMRFYTYKNAYGPIYKNDICINLSWSGTRNGEYEPYEKHSYPLDSTLTLRGIPKLDAQNNLYYDGDEYLPDGTVNRRYGVVDLGTLTWNTTSNRAACRIPNLKQPPSATRLANIVTEKWNQVPATNTLTDGQFAVLNQSNNIIFYYGGTMPSGLFVYELDTPTTETADPYLPVIPIDKWGIESFITSGIVPIGHKTRYVAKLDNLPSLAGGDGYYIIDQTGDKMSLSPITETHIPSLNASKITAGTFGADRIPALDASKISSGTLSADRIPDLGASKITSGTFAVERIPDLNASKITDGTLSADRLPASGVTAGSYGPSGNQYPAQGGTFSVPSITADAKGRVTSAFTKTVTLPTYSTATSSADGLMSATDKSKLDSMTTVPLASGLNMTEGTDGLIFTYVS